jgi:hypothetical protein
MSDNPFYEPAQDGSPLIELKQGIVLYVPHPPNPATARLVYDYYLMHCGKRVRVYRSTAPGSQLKKWNQEAQRRFENQELPNIRQRDHWGYLFSDQEPKDSWLFMFHGYRPYSEPGKASFYRFDFDWQVDLTFLQDFAQGIIELVPCLSGFGGYYLQGRLAFEKSSYNRMFALARRYWGVEAHNLDVTVNHMLEGYKCLNWLTIIGDQFRQKSPGAIEAAKQVAHSYHETPYATLLQAQAVPEFCDRHRQEVLDGYTALANALLPLQVTRHDPLGGDMWDEDNTMTYLRRFTHPNEMV